MIAMIEATFDNILDQEKFTQVISRNFRMSFIDKSSCLVS